MRSGAGAARRGRAWRSRSTRRRTVPDRRRRHRPPVVCRLRLADPGVDEGVAWSSRREVGPDRPPPKQPLTRHPDLLEHPRGGGIVDVARRPDAMHGVRRRHPFQNCASSFGRVAVAPVPAREHEAEFCGMTADAAPTAPTGVSSGFTVMRHMYSSPESQRRRAASVAASASPMSECAGQSTNRVTSGSRAYSCTADASLVFGRRRTRRGVVMVSGTTGR